MTTSLFIYVDGPVDASSLAGNVHLVDLSDGSSIPVAASGIATIAIDLPFHGSRSLASGDNVNNVTAAPGADGFGDEEEDLSVALFFGLGTTDPALERLDPLIAYAGTGDRDGVFGVHFERYTQTETQGNSTRALQTVKCLVRAARASGTSTRRPAAFRLVSPA